MRSWLPLALSIALMPAIAGAVATPALGASPMQGHDMATGSHTEEGMPADGTNEAGMESHHANSGAFAGAALWAGLATLVAPAPVLAMKKRFTDTNKILIVMLSASAGMLHLLLIPDHQANFAYGTFFVVAGVAQLNFALVFMARQEKRVAVAGIMGNIAMMILYLVTRVADLPAPFAGAEPVDPIGVITSIVQASLIALLACHAASLRKPERAPGRAVQRQLEVH